MSYEELLTQRATLQRATVTRNSATGDEVESWTTTETDVICYERAVTGREDLPLGLLESVTNKIHMPYRIDILVGRWRAIIDGKEFRLVSVLDPGNRHHHLEVWARRMNA